MSGIYRGVNGSATADALNIDGDKGDLTIGNSGLDWEINPDTVTFAKMQNISTDTVLGRATAGSGDVEEIPCTAAGRALLDDANAAAQRATLGVVPGTDVLAYDANLQSFVNTFTLPTVDGTAGFILTTNGAGTLSLLAPAGVTDGDKGDITVSGTGTVWEIDAGVVSTTELGGDITAAGKALLDDADASAQRTTLGLGSAALNATNDFVAQTSLTGSAVLPSGTTAQRDGSPVGGYIRFNQDVAKAELYNGSAWTGVGGGATGGGQDEAFVENDNLITESYVIGQGAQKSGVTVDAGTNVFSLTGHGFTENQLVFFMTSGTLPAPLEQYVGYYVIASGLTADAFKLSETLGGAEINITDTGTGAYTVGKVKNAISAGKMVTADGVTVTIPTGAFYTTV